MEDKVFRQQVQDDIKILQDNLRWDKHIHKPEYAFNYWILSYIYNLDVDVCQDNITEYNDKAIDCFVHYEEDKELYIIQNKYYGKSTQLSHLEVSDFLTRPIANLKKGNYKHDDLQKIYNQAKTDKDYKIFLHFYVTNDLISREADNLIRRHPVSDAMAELFYLKDIKTKYYGKTYKENVQLDATLKYDNDSNRLKILPEPHNLPNMTETYYVMARVFDIYKLVCDAEKAEYPLFEENIREYLGGTSGINKGIINTLKSEERSKFFYYNNGITIICDKVEDKALSIKMKNPQVVNGCQTVNSITEVLKKDESAESNYSKVFVMAKVFVPEKSENNQEFCEDIVKYTNSQNAIDVKAFGAKHQLFLALQKSMEERGLLLYVMQSDKHKFKEKYKKDKEKGVLLEKSQKNAAENFYQFETLSDVQIQLITLILIIGAFEKDAQFAYTKKVYLLRPTHALYKFSTSIQERYTVDSMAKLVVLYKKSEFDKKQSENKRTPAPYYLLNFLGFYLESRNIDKNEFLKKVSNDQLDLIYGCFKDLPDAYYQQYTVKHAEDYNRMLKQKVDRDIMGTVLDDYFTNMKIHNPSKYEEFMEIFKNS